MIIIYIFNLFMSFSQCFWRCQGLHWFHKASSLMAHFHGTLGTIYQRFVKDTTIKCSGNAGCGESAFASAFVATSSVASILGTQMTKRVACRYAEAWAHKSSGERDQVSSMIQRKPVEKASCELKSESYSECVEDVWMVSWRIECDFSLQNFSAEGISRNRLKIAILFVLCLNWRVFMVDVAL